MQVANGTKGILVAVVAVQEKKTKKVKEIEIMPEIGLPRTVGPAPAAIAIKVG